MGRRPSPKKGKLIPINLRTTREIRDKLEAAAAANGRSLSAELEERVVDSFRNRDEFFGGEENYMFMRLLAVGIETIEHGHKRRWRDDHDTLADVIAYVVQQFGAIGNVRLTSRDNRRAVMKQAATYLREHGHESSAAIIDNVLRQEGADKED